MTEGRVKGGTHPTKRPGTVGQPRSAANGASHMLSLQAQEHGESGTVTVAVWHGNRMTNSIRVG